MEDVKELPPCDSVMLGARGSTGKTDAHTLAPGGGSRAIGKLPWAPRGVVRGLPRGGGSGKGRTAGGMRAWAGCGVGERTGGVGGGAAGI